MENIIAQLCSGSWAVQRPITETCVTGQYVGQNLTGNPAGCPTNPIYTSLQTNTFTFTQPVSTFSIDFIGFDGSIQCPRMEIKVNGVFYPLTIANLVDIPSALGCTHSFQSLAITSEGYITIGSFSPYSAQGRIIINNVATTSVTVSTNDGNGTTFSNPFNCTTVPLKLESFTGKNDKCKSILDWKTGVEQNIKNIEVEKSEDGLLFRKAGEIAPKGSNSQYSFTILTSIDSYFRLKINDLDGYYEYSRIIYLKSSCNENSYVVIPNPTSDQLEIVGLKNNDEVLILDMLGNVVTSFHSSQNTKKFNIQMLPAGMYIFQVINGTRKASLKVIKY